MPKALLDFMGYKFYFWTNENNEPVHIHVSKGKPIPNATKFWLKRDGIEMAGENTSVDKADLKYVQKYICANRATIIAKWYDTFGF